MLISHKHRFVFTKTVKTAGTSVELLLEPFCAGAGHRVTETTDAVESAVGVIGARGAPEAVQQARWYNHMPAAIIKAQLGAATWDAYCKFTVVRNPYDKMVSWFHFRHLPQSLCAEMDFAEIKARFRRYILGGARLAGDDLSPAMDRDKYAIDGALCVDRLLRYEDLDAELRALAGRLGLDLAGRELPRAKGQYRPPGRHHRDYYDDDSAAVIARAFDFELATFGYRL